MDFSNHEPLPVGRYFTCSKIIYRCALGGEITPGFSTRGVAERGWRTRPEGERPRYYAATTAGSGNRDGNERSEVANLGIYDATGVTF